MSSRNLKYQFLYAINSNFTEGANKHSLKKDGKMNHTRIYSYSDREQLKNLSAALANWMKIEHPEIRMVKEIKADHIQEYLNEKALTCSDATLTTYASLIGKLENIVNVTYGIKTRYRGFQTPKSASPGKIRNKSMSSEDLEKIEQTSRNSRSSGKLGVQLSDKLGLRACEIVKLKGMDIKLDKGIVHIHESKGKRSRDIPIRKEDEEYFAALKRAYSDNERICPIQKDSLQKAVRRFLEYSGLSESYPKTGIHAIRKKYAQEEYDKCRKLGLEIKESLDKVSELLGHGEDRDTLIKEYVLNVY